MTLCNPVAVYLWHRSPSLPRVRRDHFIQNGRIDDEASPRCLRSPSAWSGHRPWGAQARAPSSHADNSASDVCAYQQQHGEFRLAIVPAQSVGFARRTPALIAPGQQAPVGQSDESERLANSDLDNSLQIVSTPRLTASSAPRGQQLNPSPGSSSPRTVYTVACRYVASTLLCSQNADTSPSENNWPPGQRVASKGFHIPRLSTLCSRLQ